MSRSCQAHGTSPMRASCSSSSQVSVDRLTSRAPRMCCRFTISPIDAFAPLERWRFRVGPYGANRFLTVSRDGSWAVASHVDRWERDILVVDRFR